MRTRTYMLIALVLMLASVGYFLWSELSTAGTYGFPLDDSWIHAQFARNLALGNGFSYNPGVPVSGSTAPLWTLLTAAGYLVTGDPVLAAKVMGVLFLGLTVFFMYTLVRAISNDPKEALFAAILAGTLPRLVWASLSGMEVSLAVMLSLAGVAAHVLYSNAGDRRQYFSTLLFGLAALARPECTVFFVAAMLDRALAATFIRWREVAAKDWIVPVLIHICVFFIVIAPFLIFSRKFGIGFLPNTAYAKALLWDKGLIAALATGSKVELIRSFTTNPFDYFMSFLHEGLNNNPVLFMFAGVGFFRLIFQVPYGENSQYRSFIIPLAAVLFPLAIGVVVPFGQANYQEGRYIAPVAPLMLVVGVVGIYAAAGYAARVFSEAKFLGRPARLVLERSIVWLLVLFALASQTRNVWYRAQVYGKEVSNIEEMQVSIGKWIGLNLPADALLALNDVGAITYFSQRRVLDTVGLISPEVLDYCRRGERLEDAAFRFLRARRPDYAVLFPNWYPDIVRRGELAEPIHRVVLDENVICGGKEMVVYRMHWDALEDSETRSKSAPPPDGGGEEKETTR
ncbi:MAG: glycosyltransferase family 39 protein [Candidatus Eisenbacteria bacterium]